MCEDRTEKMKKEMKSRGSYWSCVHNTEYLQRAPNFSSYKKK